MSPAIKPRLVRLADLVTKKVPEFVTKHPATAAGIGALGIGIDQMSDYNSPAARVENSIMRESIGGPTAKYACQELADLDARKTFVATKVSFEKVADEFNPAVMAGSKAVDVGVGEGLMAIRKMIGAAAQAIKDRFSDEPKRRRIMDDVLTNDPVVSTFEQEQPGGAQAALYTMKQFAPTLSTNPAVVQSFLRNAAMSGGPLDYQTARGLADAEASVLKARQQRSW